MNIIVKTVTLMGFIAIYVPMLVKYSAYADGYDGMDVIEPKNPGLEYEVFEKFLADEIPAGYYDSPETFYFSDLANAPDAYVEYSPNGYLDLDNDGRDELMLNGPYGGMFLDSDGEEVYVFAQGDGTAFMLGYAEYKGTYFVVYSDVTHTGRQTFWFEEYAEGDTLVDEFNLYAEYYENDNDRYDENSTFVYRDEPITMEEYEALRKEYIGW